MPEEEGAAEEDSVHEFFGVEDGYEGLDEADTDSTLVFEGGVDGSYFFEHVDVVKGELADPLEIF